MKVTAAILSFALLALASPASLDGENNLVARATNGTIGVVSKKCPNTGATVNTTAKTGPNGSEDWLNCGVNQSGGWQPPNVKASDLIFTELTQALKSFKTPYKACSKYLSMINQTAAKYGVPPIMIAGIMMQESSCDPNTIGGSGEQGLMQIKTDKCKGAPGGNCRDPAFNIDAGTKYLAKVISEANGNVILGVGSYNGWYRGMTVSQATAGQRNGCCFCQVNLDYLHQFFNGWMQNINAYDVRPRLGEYFNLDPCGP